MDKINISCCRTNQDFLEFNMNIMIIPSVIVVEEINTSCYYYCSVNA